MATPESIQEMIKALPPERQREAEDFIRFLFQKQAGKKGKRLRQDWSGALKDFREQYTSLELQKSSGVAGGLKLVSCRH